MTSIKEGSVVRTKGHGAYPDGTEFTVSSIHWATIPILPDSRFYVIGDPCGRGVWEQYLELAPPRIRDRVQSTLTSANELILDEDLNSDAATERLILANEDLQRALRKRNATIDVLRAAASNAEARATRAEGRLNAILAVAAGEEPE